MTLHKINDLARRQACLKMRTRYLVLMTYEASEIHVLKIQSTASARSIMPLTEAVSILLAFCSRMFEKPAFKIIYLSRA